MCMCPEVNAPKAPPQGAPKAPGVKRRREAMSLTFFFPKLQSLVDQNPKLLLLEVGRQRGDLLCFFSGERGTGSGTGGQWLWCLGHSTLRLVPITPLSQHRPASALHLHPINSPDQIANIPGEYAPPHPLPGQRTEHLQSVNILEEKPTKGGWEHHVPSKNKY